MARYWVIAPFNSQDPEVWDAIWEFDLSHGVISIGWGAAGDVSTLSESEIRRELMAHWPDYKPNAATQAARSLHKFFHDIHPGDFIVARFGRKCVAGIGKVIRKAYYDPTKVQEVFERFGPEYEAIGYPNHIDVEWSTELGDYYYDEQIFGLTTLYEIPEETFLWLTEGETDSAESEETPDNAGNEAEFVLERYLEEFIVSNFSSIFQGKLVLFSDPEEGIIGQQFRTDVGIIDILAQDVQTGEFVVVELKKGRQADRVVGQILRYMGWISESLCQGDQGVRGIVICQESDQKLNYAIKMVRNVSIKYYQINFKLSDEPA